MTVSREGPREILHLVEVAEAEGGPRIGPDGATLAELVALRKREPSPAAVQDVPSSATGFYL